MTLDELQDTVLALLRAHDTSESMPRCVFLKESPIYAALVTALVPKEIPIDPQGVLDPNRWAAKCFTLGCPALRTTENSGEWATVGERHYCPACYAVFREGKTEMTPTVSDASCLAGATKDPRKALVSWACVYCGVEKIPSLGECSDWSILPVDRHLCGECIDHSEQLGGDPGASSGDRAEITTEEIAAMLGGEVVTEPEPDPSTVDLWGNSGAQLTCKVCGLKSDPRVWPSGWKRSDGVDGCPACSGVVTTEPACGVAEEEATWIPRQGGPPGIPNDRLNALDDVEACDHAMWGAPKPDFGERVINLLAEIRDFNREIVSRLSALERQPNKGG